MKVPTLVVKFKEQAELDEIKRDAHAHNMNVSEYIRYLVAKERKEKRNGLYGRSNKVQRLQV